MGARELRVAGPPGVRGAAGLLLMLAVWGGGWTAAPGRVIAQDPATPGPTVSQEVQPAAPVRYTADTSSPRATLRSFIESANELYRQVRDTGTYDRRDPRVIALGVRILDCLDSRNLPAFASKQQASEAAVCIKEILDRVDLPPWESIPDTQAIEAAGGIEKLSVWRVPGTRISIAREEEGPQKHEYLFSPGTVKRSLDYYHAIASEPYRTGGPPTSPGLYRWYVAAPGHPAIAWLLSKVPQSWWQGRTAGMANWKWPGLLVAILFTIAVMVALYRRQLLIGERMRQASIPRYLLSLWLPVAAMLMPLLLKYFAEQILTLRSIPQYVVAFACIATSLLAGVVVIFSLNRRLVELIISSPQVNPRGLNAQLIRIVGRLTALVATVTLFLVGGQYLGIPVATLLASAGIGGVAVALGAQDTLKTLFGTLSIMADRPFRVGDRIVFLQYDGIVEDIGLRSTRLRLLTGHQVTLPNDQLARSDIENVARRDFIRRSSSIHLPLDTDRAKVQQAVELVREILRGRSDLVESQPTRVFFADFQPDGFVIRLTYWYASADYWEFMAAGDEVNFQILQKFSEAGIQFSLPKRHSYWERADRRGALPIRVDGPKAPAAPSGA